MPEKNEHELEIATVGGGCFWCMEALFGDLEGVPCSVSGYAGGNTINPTYRDVCQGHTGYAEVVQLRIHPPVLSYSDLLRIFLVMHNPTIRSLRSAYDDWQYRSVIFYHSEAQRQIANKVIQEQQPLFEKPIGTIIAPYTEFYKAAEHQQQYYKKDPGKPYCKTVINPKLAMLRQQVKERLKAKLPAAG